MNTHHPNDIPSRSPAPRPTILHVYTAAAGYSRIHRCVIEGLTFDRIVANVPPVWRTVAEHDVASHAIWVLPTGWRGGWHRNPARQWVIPLRGRWFVETQDGARVEMGPVRRLVARVTSSRNSRHPRTDIPTAP